MVESYSFLKSFSGVEFTGKRKQTCREVFLAKMNATLP